MKVDMEILDAGLVAAEKLYMSLRAHKQIVGDIVSLDDEAKRAKADATEAKRALAKLNAEIAAAQDELLKVQQERTVVEEKVRALSAERAELDSAIAAIKNMFKSAA
jgi:predicted  nucleic acid-binding Zn-ribbon protein